MLPAGIHDQRPNRISAVAAVEEGVEDCLRPTVAIACQLENGAAAQVGAALLSGAVKIVGAVEDHARVRVRSVGAGRLGAKCVHVS